MAERKPQRVSRARLSNFFRSPLFKILLSIFLFFFIGASAILLFFYNHYSRIIDRRLSGEIFKNTAQIYAAPYRVYPGQRLVWTTLFCDSNEQDSNGPIKREGMTMAVTKSRETGSRFVQKSEMRCVSTSQRIH